MMPADCRMTAASTMLATIGDCTCKDTAVNSLHNELLVIAEWPNKLLD